MAEDTRTLIDAARAGDREEVERRLIRDPGSVHARAVSTPRAATRRCCSLRLAAAGGHGEAVESLLARGADPQARDAQGRSAADHAAARGHAELASRLSAR